ncbi:alpha-1,3-mannosyl-glycoprotein 4-beta-N-acetylglucosaminyltransferase C-like [Pseudophryne corroboree]|uniref:alpha-1,3-mannosyl-glycoprotein 4-beta-N-acetylglucosaminyltransferase C-like n=1 Tax=Pseudophryne corroboree TaxID=495146 RepID=UPI0030812AEA
MRRYHVWTLLCVSCFLTCAVLLMSRSSTEIECPDQSDPYLKKEEHIFQGEHLFDVKKDALETLNIPYTYLLGSLSKRKRFLTIGISSVKREKSNYLLTTIESIFHHSSQEELDQLIVVIYMANTKHTQNRKTAEEIERQFHSEIAAGHLIVISSYINAYPPLDNLKRNYNDPPNRVTFRSKQNVDYAFLVNFCANMSQYYLMLEDDVTCAMNFLTSIKTYIQKHNAPWTTVTFSNLGYIGKLYHSEDLQKLARFLLLFYDEMPCDWLLDLFYQSKTQRDKIQSKPSLFQHIGFYSSFQGSENKLKDKDFAETVEPYGDHPPASCFSDIKVYKDNTPDNVCFAGPSFFWGSDIKAGNYFTMTFNDAINIERISIITGTSQQPTDILRSGNVELGRQKVQSEGKKSCKLFSNIGKFENGTFSLDRINSAAGKSIDCLKIQVSASQAEWLIIQKVGIWVRQDTNTQ